MLALARKPGQGLRIGADVVLIFLAAEGPRARLRIQTRMPITCAHREIPLPAGGGSRELLCRAGEAFRIGTDIWVSVARIMPGRAVIGVEADRSIPVDREELYLRKRLR